MPKRIVGQIRGGGVGRFQNDMFLEVEVSFLHLEQSCPISRMNCWRS